MKIPKNWDKIPLKNFVHYLEYMNEEAETLEQRFDLLYKRACAILDITVEEAKALSIEQQSQLIKLINKKMPTRLMLQFKHKGIKYRPIIKVEKLNGGKYAAIKNAAKRGTAKNLHQILFLVCEPVKFGFKKQFPFIGYKPYEFTPEEIGARINDFKDIPMEIANPISVFFLTLSKELSNLLNDYSVQHLLKLTEEMAQLQASLEKDMDGIQ